MAASVFAFGLRERRHHFFISHDIGAVRVTADRVMDMYLGRVMVQGRALDLLEASRHPYTRRLIGSVPLPDPTRELAS